MKEATSHKELEIAVDYYTRGLMQAIFTLDDNMKKHASKTLQNYLKMPIECQRLVRKATEVKGKVPIKTGKHGGFVFQMHGKTLQIKLYEPKKYKNEKETPLRKRARAIGEMVKDIHFPEKREKMRELYRTYPYYLLKSERINLRLKNFYFEYETLKGILIKIYKAADPENPNPETDPLYAEKEYSPKNTIAFQFTDETEQHFYAVNTRNNEVSNVLHFYWED
jgi:hypothetical protein